ncbi:MAG: glycosyltransferase family 4 protein [Bacteroidales bacterium]|jgi:glycosyltransferase involved in cell wall biosynthesis|nr:glycosyltransferase family 4 protein [Bacteroidales bacterium]
MKVLHINNAYSITPLYKYLIAALSKKQLQQIIYVPIRRENDRNKNIVKFETVQYIFSKIHFKIIRPFYFLKTIVIFLDLITKISIKDIDVVHSHFLMSNGGVAYLVKLFFRKKYITAVRNTDLFTYLKYQPYLKFIAYQILKHADRIVLISPAYLYHLKKLFSTKQIEKIINKIDIIPNGVEDYWIQNAAGKSKKPDQTNLTLIYVGAFNRGKNIENIVKTCFLLREKINVKLKLIGGGGNNHKKIMHLIKENSSFISFYGQVRDRDRLAKLFRESDIFIMPSFRETFGLTYIEAMTQGLPVVYSNYQGLYGYFREGVVGFGVDPFNPSDIKNKVLLILKNYETMSSNVIKEINSFDWDKIAEKYNHLYCQVFSNAC